MDMGWKLRFPSIMSDAACLSAGSSTSKFFVTQKLYECSTCSFHLSLNKELVRQRNACIEPDFIRCLLFLRSTNLSLEPLSLVSVRQIRRVEIMGGANMNPSQLLHTKGQFYVNILLYCASNSPVIIVPFSLKSLKANYFKGRKKRIPEAL